MIFPEQYRIEHPMNMNCFLIPYQSYKFKVIASIYSNGWEHISISLRNCNPNWDEMCYFKNLFWGDDEQCIQFHPRRKEYVNMHDHCLHIFKPAPDVQKMLDVHGDVDDISMKLRG